MKSFFLLLAFLICNFSLFAQVQEPTPNQTQDLPDTVWTKNIPEKILGVMFSQDGSQVYVSTMVEDFINGVDTSYYRVWIISTLTGDSIRTVSNVGTFKVISMDGKYIYTSALKKLDAKTFEVVDSLKNQKYTNYSIFNIAISSDGNTLFVVGHISDWHTQENFNLSRVNANTMELIEYFDYLGAMTNIATSPDGKYFVTNWSDGIWNSNDNTQKLLLWDANTFKVVKEIKSDKYPIYGFKFSPDGKFFISNLFGILTIFKTNNYIERDSLNDYPIGEFAQFEFTKNSKYILCSNGKNTFVRNLDFNKNPIVNIYPSCSAHGLAISSNQQDLLFGCAYDITLIRSNFNLTKLENNIFNPNNLELSPNPVNNNNFNIVFTNSNGSNYNINIYDNMNRQISNIFSNYLEAGKHSFQFNTTNLANGVYFCRVESNNLNLSTKFIINK